MAPKAGTRWTVRDVAYVRRNYKKLTTKEMALRLGRTYWGVQAKINSLGLPHELNDHTEVEPVVIIKKKVSLWDRLFGRA